MLDNSFNHPFTNLDNSFNHPFTNLDNSFNHPCTNLDNSFNHPFTNYVPVKTTCFHSLNNTLSFCRQRFHYLNTFTALHIYITVRIHTQISVQDPSNFFPDPTRYIHSTVPSFLRDSYSTYLLFLIPVLCYSLTIELKCFKLCQSHEC